MSYRTFPFLLHPAMRSSGGSFNVARPYPISMWVSASASPGSAAPVVCAATAAKIKRTSVSTRALRVTRSMAVTRSIIADSRYCLALPPHLSDVEAAPLLCAGLIGYRAYRAAGTGSHLGLYGFGAAAHLLAQVGGAEGRRIFAFTKDADVESQRFALSLGAAWAGASTQPPPEPLDAAIIFASVGALVPAALAAVRPGGRVICAGIHMSDIPTFPYSMLWGERSVSSVANRPAPMVWSSCAHRARINLRPTVEVFELSCANDALQRLRSGQLTGAAVLKPAHSGS